MLFDFIKILAYKLVVAIAIVADDNISVIILFDELSDYLYSVGMQVKKSEIVDDG